MLYYNPFLIFLATDWSASKSSTGSDGIKHPVIYVYVSTSIKSLAEKPFDDDHDDAEDSSSSTSSSTPSELKVSLEWLKMLAAPCKTVEQDLQYDNAVLVLLYCLSKFNIFPSFCQLTQHFSLRVSLQLSLPGISRYVPKKDRLTKDFQPLNVYVHQPAPPRICPFRSSTASAERSIHSSLRIESVVT
jgi:hypothetical protein